MIYTYQDAANLVAEHIEGGLCPEHPTTLKRINEAVRRIIKRDDYNFTLDQVRIYTLNNSVSLPREYVAARLVDINCCPVPIKSQAFEYIASGPGKCTWEQYTALIDEGTRFPTFFDIPKDTTDWYLIAYSTSAADAAMSITWRGRDDTGSEILSSGSPMNTLRITQWGGGIEGTMGAMPTQLTSVPVRVLTGISLPTGRVGYTTLYAYDPSSKQMYFLSKYAPSETLPGYRRYRLPRFDSTNGVYVDLLCKKQFIEATSLQEQLLIQDLDAVKQEVFAVESSNRGDVNGEVSRSQLADREMRRMQSNENRGVRFDFVGFTESTRNMI